MNIKILALATVAVMALRIEWLTMLVVLPWALGGMAVFLAKAGEGGAFK